MSIYPLTYQPPLILEPIPRMYRLICMYYIVGLIVEISGIEELNINLKQRRSYGCR